MWHNWVLWVLTFMILQFSPQISAKKFPQKKVLQNFTPLVKLNIQRSHVECCWWHLFKTSLSFRNKTMKLPLVHYRCAVVAKKFTEKDCLMVLSATLGQDVQQ